jgi:hypothetical protein
LILIKDLIALVVTIGRLSHWKTRSTAIGQAFSYLSLPDKNAKSCCTSLSKDKL